MLKDFLFPVETKRLVQEKGGCFGQFSERGFV